MEFNPQAFLQATTQEAGSTKFDPIPKGVYNAQISKVDFRPVEMTKGPSAGQTLVSMDILWDIANPVLEEQLGRRPQVRQNFFVDLLPNGGGFDMGRGKNVQMNRVREAVGQNVPGQAWAPEMLMGAMAQIEVTNTPSKDNPEDVFSNVKKVGRIT